MLGSQNDWNSAPKVPKCSYSIFQFSAYQSATHNSKHEYSSSFTAHAGVALQLKVSYIQHVHKSTVIHKEGYLTLKFVPFKAFQLRSVRWHEVLQGDFASGTKEKPRGGNETISAVRVSISKTQIQQKFKVSMLSMNMELCGCPFKSGCKVSFFPFWVQINLK